MNINRISLIFSGGGVFSSCLSSQGSVYSFGDCRNSFPTIETYLRGINISKYNPITQLFRLISFI
jgi:hypothetical protein